MSDNATFGSPSGDLFQGYLGDLFPGNLGDLGVGDGTMFVPGNLGDVDSAASAAEFFDTMTHQPCSAPHGCVMTHSDAPYVDWVQCCICDSVYGADAGWFHPSCVGVIDTSAPFACDECQNALSL
jgi:hypothetical protein